MRNLQAEMKRYGISVRDIQKVINCSEKTIRSKINEKSVFSLPEARKIRDTFFKNLSLEYLFANDKPTPDDDPTNHSPAS